MTLCTIFSELSILWLPNMVWWYIILSQSVLWKKLDYCIQRSRSLWRVKMSMCVQIIFSKSPDIWFPDLVLLCMVMSRSVTQKDWLAVFKVKVSARADMIKIWQFLLYLLNYWSFCYIIISQSVLWRNWIVVFKVKVTAKFHDVNECMSKWYLLNCWTFYY